ncbi:hypothetical protein LIER_00782 [Lithospermum erythrorhizon]|uniref:Uncharacterized protein n=1 Tax=Lithospermum erythrorhizon TaxID=34254 RepID=A0AAV3NK30_LITER
MRYCCPGFRSQIDTCLRDYDRIQYLAIILIYIQIGCALIGSLGAFYNGVLLINLVISLFALVAIESSSQSLGRTYAVLLFCAILLDLCWLILFSNEIWNISGQSYGTFAIFSVKLTLTMQIVGFGVRLFSSLLWIQMYRLGASYVNSSGLREADADLRNSFLNPATSSTFNRDNSGSYEALGGSIYNPAYYSSLFEDGKDEAYLDVGDRHLGVMVDSASTPENSLLTESLSSSVLKKDGDRNLGVMVDSAFTPENSQLRASLSSSLLNKDGDRNLGVMADSASTPESSQLTASLSSSILNKDGGKVSRLLQSV